MACRIPACLKITTYFILIFTDASMFLILAFKEMLVTGDESPNRAPKKKEHIAKLQQDPRQR